MREGAVSRQTIKKFRTPLGVVYNHDGTTRGGREECVDAGDVRKLSKTSKA